MRIALCISGQIRNAQQTLPKLAAFAREMQADVFVSTWAQPGTKVSGIQGIWHVERMFGPLFCGFLPPWLWRERGVAGALPGFEPEMQARVGKAAGPVTAAMLQEHFPGARIDIEDAGALDLGFETQASDTNSLRMLYKLWRCNELRRAAEKQAGTPYDVVVRALPDIVPGAIPAALLGELAAPGCRTVLVDDIQPGAVGDKLAISGAQAADDYAALFGIAMSAPARPWRGIHRELDDYLKALGWQPRLHRASWQFSEDAAMQAVGREVLLRQIAGGPHAPDIPATPAQLQVVGRILAVADRLAAGDHVAARDLLAPVLAEACGRMDGEDTAYLALVLATLVLSAAQEPRAACAAAVLAWCERGRLGRLAEKPPEPHEQAVSRAVSALAGAQSPLSGDRAAVLAWLAEEAAHPLLAPVLPRLRDAAMAEPLEAALPGLLSVAERSPANIEALRKRGFQCLGQGNDLPGAREAAEAMIRLAPASWYGYDLMGHVLEREGDHEGCLAQAKLALARGASYGPLHARVGSVLTFRLKRPHEAVPYLERATAMWNDARAWHWLAVALEGSGDKARALAAIDEALKRDAANAAYRAARQRLAAA